mmetsp:Transcript_3139/g.7384  ORF Transcript_3139/g.7384 Transcript_3139/m.7384 type:complete len:141 (-) Transcript_3139:35-457(-)
MAVFRLFILASNALPSSDCALEVVPGRLESAVPGGPKLTLWGILPPGPMLAAFALAFVAFFPSLIACSSAIFAAFFAFFLPIAAAIEAPGIFANASWTKQPERRVFLCAYDSNRLIDKHLVTVEQSQARIIPGWRLDSMT